MNSSLTDYVQNCATLWFDSGPLGVPVTAAENSELEHEFNIGLNGADEEVPPLIDEVFSALESGLAVFDAQFNLVQANSLYCELCEYEPETVTPGTSLESLIERSLRNLGKTASEIKVLVDTVKRRLNAGGSQKFRFETATGRHIEIHRIRPMSGKLIEVVQRVDGPSSQISHADQLNHMASIAHERMSHVLESLIDGFALFDADDNLVFYNRSFVRLNPCVEDLIRPGISYTQLMRESIDRGAINTLGMENEQYLRWRMHQHYNPGEEHEYETTEGRCIKILEQQNADGSISAMLSDITDIRRREQELHQVSGALTERNDQFNFAVNHMIQGLCMFDAEQRLLLCNRQYLKMYGFSEEEVKPGITLSEIMMYSISLGNYREEDAQTAMKARHDPDRLKNRTTIKQFLADGRVMAVMNEPMSNGGSIATYQDITQIEQHEATLRNYTNKLERSNRELQDFAYVASHDLQEPLRKIEAFGDRLATKHADLLPDDGKMFIDRMQNAATRMRQLINDLLGYSRVTTQAKPFAQVDIGDVLNGVLSDLQMALQDSNGKVEFANMPVLDAEKTQMRQLFQNLLSNALKFRKEDRDPVITITATEMPPDQLVPRAHWEFRLADNGIGFDNAYKDQIFTIFQRLHGRTEYEGTGIGLATCRKIIERHEGHIDADGVPDQGATFIIKLPKNQHDVEDSQQ